MGSDRAVFSFKQERSVDLLRTRLENTKLADTLAVTKRIGEFIVSPFLEFPFKSSSHCTPGKRPAYLCHWRKCTTEDFTCSENSIARCVRMVNLQGPCCTVSKMLHVKGSLKSFYAQNTGSHCRWPSSYQNNRSFWPCLHCTSEKI